MKKIFTLILSLATASTVFAGGTMTNTNQSAAFLRSLARGTTLDTDAVYYNPAGAAFMADGWHIGLNNQMAKQTRSTDSTFPLFAMGVKNGGQMTKTFEGEVFSPAIPSVHITWKKERWAVMAGLGVNGGGGTIKYDDGLASFERQFAALPAAITQLGTSYGLSASQYNMDMNLEGSSMTLAFNLGAAYRITDWLSAAAMVRIGVTSNAYEGGMTNISVNPTCAALGLSGAMMPASQFFQAVGAQLGAVNPALATMAGEYAVKTADHILDVNQKGTSVSPVLALYFQKGEWSAAAKYEFKMATELEIESAEVSAKDPVINGIFPNGAKVKAETPALFSLAVSRQCGSVKVTAEWHAYFDKDAKNSFTENIVEKNLGNPGIYDGKNCCVEGNTMEYLLGAEWQISKKWLVSLGAQRTEYDLNPAFYSDMNFTNSAWCFGGGAAYAFSKKVRLNAGVMYTHYDEVTNNAVDAATNQNFTDVFKRTSIAWGLGLDLKF